MMTPWLIPPQGGPLPSLAQQLSSLTCIGLLLGTSAWWIRRVRRTEVVQAIAGAWLAAALVNAGMGLFQYFGVAYVDGLVSLPASGEAYGNLRQRNQYATLINMGLLALIWWAGQFEDDESREAKSWVWYVAAVLLGVGSAVSLSRTGLVQLLLIVAMTLIWKARGAQTKRVLITAVLTYAVGVLMLPQLVAHDVGNANLLERFQSAGDACGSRLTLWGNVLHLITLRPWLGWGWGELDYAHFMAIYEGARFCEILDNAHNLPLHLAVEFGVPAALLACTASGWLLLRARSWREQDPGRQLAWGVVVLIFLHSMLEYPLWYGPFQMALGLSVLLMWKSENAALQGTVRFLPGADVGLTLYGVCVLGAVAYAAWDYHRVSQIFYPPDFRAAAYRDNTLEKIRGTWLFQDQVQFAEFTLTPLTPGNAEHLYEMGQRVLHYSPEARVVEKLIECAVLLGRDEAARFYLARYKAAFPKEHARWAARQLEPVKPH